MRGERRDRVRLRQHPHRRTRACAPAVHAATNLPKVTGSATSGMDRMPHCSAASIAFGAHALEIDCRSACVYRVITGEPRRAELDRLLHHVIERACLSRGEQVIEVAEAASGAEGYSATARLAALAPRAAASCAPTIFRRGRCRHQHLRAGSAAAGRCPGNWPARLIERNRLPGGWRASTKASGCESRSGPYPVFTGYRDAPDPAERTQTVGP